MNWAKLAWAMWAVVPIAGLAFHFGPGQSILLHDRVVNRLAEARNLEAEALALHATAHEAHLATIEARQLAMQNPNQQTELTASHAASEESEAFRKASQAWQAVADHYGDLAKDAAEALPETLYAIQWSQSRALIRAGDIWTGIVALENILSELEAKNIRDEKLELATREEIASGYYFAARLMRLAGDPQNEWQVESGKARQHFRYLAEHPESRLIDDNRKSDHGRNVELVLDLEQANQFELEGRPLPRNSPLARTGERPGPGRRSKRPPRDGDARGAGGAEAIRSGW